MGLFLATLLLFLTACGDDNAALDATPTDANTSAEDAPSDGADPLDASGSDGALADVPATDANVEGDAPATECGSGTPCELGSYCAEGLCVAGCMNVVHCPADQVCEGGMCVLGGGFNGHEAILNDVFGYGVEASGGAGGVLVEVTNTNNAGPGSLREAVALDGPKWIYFTPGLSGTIELEELIYLNSNTTIDGRGASVRIGGHTVNVYLGTDEAADNIVLHNLYFAGGLPDGRTLLRARFGERMWLDHLTFAAQSDDGKPLGISDAATDITMSWCDFSPSDAPLIFLISSNNDSPGDANIRITAHHSLFEGTSERHPRARYATIHWLNNLVSDWGSYGSSITQEGFFFAENNVYEAGRRTDRAIRTRIGNWPDNGDPLQGNLRIEGNWWKNGTEVPEQRNPETVSAPPYEYPAATADDALIGSIRGGVGWQDVESPFE